MATTTEASTIPTHQIKKVLNGLNVNAALENLVYQALREFHKDPENDLQHPDLKVEEDEALVDSLFHKFLRKNGMALFGADAINGLRPKRHPGPPIYRDTMDLTDLDQQFSPIRKALIIVSQEWRMHQRSDLLAQNPEFGVSGTEPTVANHSIPSTGPQSIVNPSVTPSSSGYPPWASGKSAHHRDARAVLDNQTITYPPGEGCTACVKRGRVCTFCPTRITCAVCTALGVNSSKCTFGTPNAADSTNSAGLDEIKKPVHTPQSTSPLSSNSTMPARSQTPAEDPKPLSKVDSLMALLDEHNVPMNSALRKRVLSKLEEDGDGPLESSPSKRLA